MYEEGGVGRRAGEALASHHKRLLQDTDLNHIKSSLCLKGEKSVANSVLGTIKSSLCHTRLLLGIFKFEIDHGSQRMLHQK